MYSPRHSMLFRLSIVFTLMFSSLSVAANEAMDFEQCRQHWQQRASAENLDARIQQDIIPQLKPLERIIQLDRKQPEFTTTFADYLNRRLTPARIDSGAAHYQEHRDFLRQLKDTYGVPGRYLIAFWGLETNYGNYLGRVSTLNALATLACDTRRREFFTTELFNAFRLMQRENFDFDNLYGSWAGAMGQTQFMPSAYLNHAVDGDSDGKIDLWASRKDALTSGANFLQHLGWQAGQRWGREVLLPENFPYEKTGLKNRQPLSFWRGIGVTMTNGSKLPEIDTPTAILLPAGHKGAAFAVYPNFDVIMKWNMSESYALSVGLLADKISGGKGLSKPADGGHPPIRIDAIKAIQTALNTRGYDAGPADGIIGPGTRGALRDFQQANGLIADGYPDKDTQRQLGIVIN